MRKEEIMDLKMIYLEYEKLRDKDFYYYFIRTVIEYCDQISMECYGISYEEFCDSNYSIIKKSIDEWYYSQEDDSERNLFLIDVRIDKRVKKWLEKMRDIEYFDKRIESGEKRYPIISIYLKKMGYTVFELKRLWNECYITETLSEMIRDKMKR